MDDFTKGKVYLGADKDGYDLKEFLRDKLDGKGYLVVDLGVFELEEQATYNDIAREVAEKVVENHRVKNSNMHGEKLVGILISADGGKVMASANQLDGAKAFVAETVEGANEIRDKFGANILCIGSEVLSFDEAEKVVEAFLD